MCADLINEGTLYSANSSVSSAREEGEFQEHVGWLVIWVCSGPLVILNPVSTEASECIRRQQFWPIPAHAIWALSYGYTII